MVEPRFCPFEDTRTVEMVPGVLRRTLVSGANQTLVRFELARAAEVPEHTHPHEQAGTIVTGHIRIRVGGEEHELGAGASYLIPGGIPHRVVALAPTTLVEVFAPVRKEFAED